MAIASFMADQLCVCSCRLHNMESMAACLCPLGCRTILSQKSAGKTSKVPEFGYIPNVLVSCVHLQKSEEKTERPINVLLFIPLHLILWSCHFKWLQSLFTPYFSFHPSVAEAYHFAYSAMESNCWKQSHCCKVKMGSDELTELLMD